MKLFKNLFSGNQDGSSQDDSSQNGSSHPRNSDDTAPLGDFADLDLPAELNDAISELGFTNCTPVQKEVLPHSLDGKDIIAQAQTGTGKTAAFLISIIAYDLENPSLHDRPPGTPFALIIAPTRELVLQICSDAVGLAVNTDIEVISVVGGMD